MEPTLALCMIVKNEEKVISRCLNSVKHLIDYWLIIDTGSTDLTKKIICEELKTIPGELHDSKFVNFAHNRTEYMKKIKGITDYCIVLDADEVLVDNGFNKSQLFLDCYNVGYLGNSDYYYPIIFNTSLDWRYEYVVHEVPECDSEHSKTNIDTLKIIHKHDGGTVHEKYNRDIRLIHEQLKFLPNGSPQISRYTFYLANSYWDIRDYGLALQWYTKRIDIGGWDQEVYISAIRAGMCSKKLSHDLRFFEEYMMLAISKLPLRHEAYYYLGCHFNDQKLYGQALAYLSAAKRLKYPEHQLFFDRNIFDYLIDIEIAVTLYWIGMYEEAADINKRLLELGVQTDLVSKNLKYCEDKLKSSIFTLPKE